MLVHRSNRTAPLSSSTLLFSAATCPIPPAGRRPLLPVLLGEALGRLEAAAGTGWKAGEGGEAGRFRLAQAVAKGRPCRANSGFRANAAGREQLAERAPWESFGEE